MAKFGRKNELYNFLKLISHGCPVKKNKLNIAIALVSDIPNIK